MGLIGKDFAMRLLKFLLLFHFIFMVGCASPEIASYRRSIILQDESGQELSVCVARIYFRKSGVTWALADPDRRPTDKNYYLMWPGQFVAGSVYQKRVFQDPVFIPPFIVGESYGVAGQVFLRKGFAPSIWSSYSDWMRPTILVMKKGDSETMLNLLLSGSLDKFQLRELIPTGSSKGIVDKHTEADRAFLRKCYYGDGENK